MKYLKTKLLLSLMFVFLVQFLAQGQTPETSHSLTFSPQFFQIKPDYNYGLVHRGLNLKLAYELKKNNDSKTTAFNTSFAFGPSYNRGLGLSWHLTPIDYYKGYHVRKSEKYPFQIGPYFSANYQWQLYPELQSGHMNWLTSFELGVRAQIDIKLFDRNINISVSSAAVSMSSKRKESPEEYFYDLQFTDFVQNAHSNFNFAFSDQYNHTEFQIALIPKEMKRLSYAYSYEYMGQHFETDDRMMWHALNLTWKLGKIK